MTSGTTTGLMTYGYTTGSTLTSFTFFVGFSMSIQSSTKPLRAKTNDFTLSIFTMSRAFSPGLTAAGPEPALVVVVCLR